MSKKIIFEKYQTRQSDYHWQQISNSIFKHNAYVSARYNQVVNLVPKNKNLKVLDIGCGDGVLLSLISQKISADLTGVDLDVDSLKTAKTKVKAKFIKANAYKLPFKANAFNLIISSEIIEHLSDTKKYLSEITRVVKSKGLVIITTPVKISEIPEDKMHVQEFTSQELKSSLQKYFKQVSIRTSHPLWLKKLYLWQVFKLGRFYFEPFKWLINLWVIITKINPFKLSFGQPTNQIAICKYPK
ncbi:class I SAM-dependent methyltransferase [Patescibacteria group bacterium]